jgi:hypothetical protein
MHPCNTSGPIASCIAPLRLLARWSDAEALSAFYEVNTDGEGGVSQVRVCQAPEGF